MKRVFERLRTDERGFTLIAVLAIMMVLLTLSALVAASALSLSGSSKRSSNGVLAFEAAQAGLDVATYRLNEEFTKLSSTDCLSPTLTAASPTVESNTYCAAESSSSNGPTLANASYQYWNSIPLSSGYCGSLQVSSSTTLTQRCLVSVGTANGVNRRLVELLSAQDTTSTTTFDGIAALGGVTITENSKGSLLGYGSGNPAATVEVNPPNTISVSGCSPTPDVTLDPGSNNNSVNGTSDSTCSSGITTSDVSSSNWPQYTSAPMDKVFQGGDETCYPCDTALSANNDNSVLTTDGFNYNSSTRALSDNTSSVLTLSGSNPRANSGGIWTINVCDVIFSHNATSIVLNNGAVLDFLIDSPSRDEINSNGTLSSTPACSGSQANPPMTITGSSGWNYSSTPTSACNYPPGTPGNAAALRLYVEGTGSNALTMNNSQGFSGLLYAPGWNIGLTGGGGCRSVVWYGGIITNGSLTATNGLDFHSENLPLPGSSLTNQTTVFARNVPQGWAECSSTYSTSSPDASC